MPDLSQGRSDDDLKFLATLMALTMPDSSVALQRRVEQKQAEWERALAPVWALLFARESTGRERVDGQSVCSLCDGTGELEEGCSCYQCEYDDSAHRYVYPCPDCYPDEYEAWERGQSDG